MLLSAARLGAGFKVGADGYVFVEHWRVPLVMHVYGRRLVLQSALRIAQTVDGYQLRPPCAVGTASRFSTAAMSASKKPRFRSRRIR